MITVIAVVISLLKSQHKILACFNFRKHLNTLFDLKSTSNEISCLHGIRGAVMLSILIFHSITTQAITVDSNSESYRTNSDGGKYVQMNLCGSAVEAFFVIGAILVTRSMLRDLRRWAHGRIQICECLFMVTKTHLLQWKLRLHPKPDQSILSCCSNALFRDAE